MIAVTSVPVPDASHALPRPTSDRRHQRGGGVMKRTRQIYNAFMRALKEGRVPFWLLWPRDFSRMMQSFNGGKVGCRHHVSNVPHIAGSESANAAARLRACLGGSEG